MKYKTIWKERNIKEKTMKNTLSDLNNYLFEAIERITDDELTDEALDKEVGCILCPFAKRSEKIRDIATFPRYKELYIKAFDKMLKLRKEAGKNDTYGSWTDGEGVFRWWIEDTTVPGQIEFNFPKIENERK